MNTHEDRMPRVARLFVVAAIASLVSGCGLLGWASRIPLRGGVRAAVSAGGPAVSTIGTRIGASVFTRSVVSSSSVGRYPAILRVQGLGETQVGSIARVGSRSILYDLDGRVVIETQRVGDVILHSSNGKFLREFAIVEQSGARMTHYRRIGASGAVRLGYDLIRSDGIVRHYSPQNVLLGETITFTARYSSFFQIGTSTVLMMTFTPSLQASGRPVECSCQCPSNKVPICDFPDFREQNEDPIRRHVIENHLMQSRSGCYSESAVRWEMSGASRGKLAPPGSFAVPCHLGTELR